MIRKIQKRVSMKDKPVILVVDDRPENIDLLEAYLVPQGYETVKAENGEEALGKLLDNQIDLMLLDVMMPGMDGFEVIRRVRQNEPHRLLPIILITILRGKTDRVKGIKAGCDDFISAPVDKMELLARVRSLLKVKAYNDLKDKYREELESEVTRRTNELKHVLEKLQQEITERKRAEEALRVKEERYRELFDNISSGVAVFEVRDNGEDFIFVDFNKAGERLDDNRREDLIGKSIYKARPAIKEYGLTEVFKRVWKTGTAEYFPPKLYQDARLNKWYENFVYQLPTGEIVALYNDITERIQMEERLRVSLVKYKTLFDSFPLGITIADQTGKILEINRMAEKLLGLSQEKQLKRKIDEEDWQIIRTDGTPMPAEEYASVRALKEDCLVENIEMGIVRAADDIIWISVSAIPLPLETREIVITYIDITERKQAETKIKNLAKFPEENSNPVCRISKDGVLLYANLAGRKMIFDDQNRMGGKIPEKWIGMIKSTYNSGKKKQVEIEFNGKRYLFNLVPVIEYGYINLYAIDITERKLAELQIQKTLKEKEILLRELYHRTKNNMQVISAMLRIKARSENDQKLTEVFKEIEMKIMTMSLVHQKLYESKDLSHLNLKSYISSLISLIKQSYGSLMHQISIQTSMEEIPILIDMAVPLGLIINELITNAVKHAFPEHRPGEIRIVLNSTPQNNIVLEISDNGIGLPKDFDFEKDKQLGLQTVFDLVEGQMDGKITFTSQKGLFCHITLGKDLYQPRV